ncbi:P-loop containing nucleoside triphosphate hydrolase protein [Phlegmacium glaucopus]|nr:P-loop containing nucleoside triphosphate hydrolase protein [Phlegmacium glaucopus]
MVAVDEKQFADPQSRSVHVQLDEGNIKVRTRTSWWKIWIPQHLPPPPPASLEDALEIPLTKASLFSILTYAWVNPMMTLGYQRTLQASDLWKLDEARAATVLSAKFDESWERRKSEADAWNTRLEKGLIRPSFISRSSWVFQALLSGNDYARKFASLEERWRKIDGKKHPSIIFALNDTLGSFFWTAGMFKVLGDTAQIMSPLVVKGIINFAKARQTAKANHEPEPNLGIGVMMAIGLFLVTVCASIGQHQFFWRSMVTGVLARATLIKSIYYRGVHLTEKSRTRLSNSDIMNHISTDVGQTVTTWPCSHPWAAPIQIMICLIILLVQLGPSALAGFSLLVVLVPLQERVAAQQFQIRKKSMKYTDQRAKTLFEVLGSMRIIKYFSYESSFLKRIYEIRANELAAIKAILITQSVNLALAFSLPVLAASLTFVTYTHVTPGFDVAVIFSSLTLFQLLRQPMVFFPNALSATSDARNAVARLSLVFNAEIRTGASLVIDDSLNVAVQVENATFEWEEALATESNEDHNNEKGTPQSDLPFRVHNITMDVQRGTLVAVVGRVGSGKSSLLSGLIGEMRKVSGSVTFGGRVAYCSQTAWIQNATLRDNILFGQEFDEERYWRVVENCSLLPDLELLPDGDLTEIGEKGVNLSGGQRQRINMARALYYNADIVILDDSLSAVDAHVGKSLFHDAILGALRKQGKTVIFVTHALHFLSYCDYIYTLRDGRLAEQGTFQELIAADGEFARLDKEYGGNDSEPTEKPQAPIAVAKDVKSRLLSAHERAGGTGKLEGKLIIKEQRTTGSISRQVYKSYILAGKGYFTIPLILLAVILMQGSQIINSYTLVWWQANRFHRNFSFYQILYASLGISQSIFTLLVGFCTDTFSYFVSRNLHHSGVYRIFYAPMSFFDTTPMGRIIGVFGKDIDTYIFQSSISFSTLSNDFSFYTVIVAVVSFCGYQYFAAFYRASAREVTRLDSMLRSVLYSHLSESLTGLPTIRTYGEIPRFLKDNAYYIDLENRALILTVTNQRWLAIRLDFCGAILVLSVALFVALGVSGSSAAQVGLVLTYTTSLTQACRMMTRQSAEVENYLNSVERVVHYSEPGLMKQEAPHEIEESKPCADWPAKGAIEFKEVTMRYRPGLPNVLHGISLAIRGGEKIGIVGRTGAGKSSITLALLRIVEYAGSITVDDVDISKVGLKDLRTKISIIPQDPTIFSGTVRTALDPFSLYDDARLWDALRRSFLVEEHSLQNSKDISEESSAGRITLDTVLETGGSNLSVGEKSLLSLARALVRDTRIVILDEATASVDLETDSKIQQTIQTEFEGKTLICIAHRLRTILSYDRILVLDGGQIAEFDTPLNLYRKYDGLFRALCDESNISENDIF